MTREEAIYKLEQTKRYCKYLSDDEIAAVAMAIKALEQEPKTGHWIESHEHIFFANVVKEWTNWCCSECDAPNDKPTDYCPNCGAKMQKVRTSNDKG